MTLEAEAPQTIHDAGDPAIEELQLLLAAHGRVVQGPRSGRNAATVPDIAFTPAGEPTAISVEVKKTGRGTSQMRPLSYMVTVVWKPPRDARPCQWWVIPPDELLLYAASRSGQHCTSSFECMNPGAPSREWDRWTCEPQDIIHRIQAAHTQGVASPLRALAEQMSGEVAALFECHKGLVRTAAENARERTT